MLIGTEHGHGHAHDSTVNHDVELLSSPILASPVSAGSRMTMDVSAIVGQSRAVAEQQHSKHHHAKRDPALKQHANLGLLGVLAHLLGDVINSKPTI